VGAVALIFITGGYKLGTEVLQAQKLSIEVDSYCDNCVYLAGHGQSCQFDVMDVGFSHEGTHKL
jgi:hypothetical protein